MKRTLSELAQQVIDLKNSPSQLSDLNVDIAARFAFLSDKRKDLKVERAIFWNKKFTNPTGEKQLSDSSLEAMWNQTESGQKEIRLKYELESLAHLMSAIKSSIVISSVEARSSM